MRGAVSLATALALPLVTDHGPFPQRDLLVYLTFCVIFATLVLQGLSLPGIIRLLGIAEDGSAAQEEVQARLGAARAALDRLDAVATDDGLPAEVVKDLRGHFAARVEHLQAHADGTADEAHTAPAQGSRDLQRELVDLERRTVIGMRNRDEISDSVLRRIERDLDLEEVRLTRSAD
jgi:CPA1 family monovalent cation:H+ antiporter